MAHYRYRQFLYEPAPEWNGKNWIAAVVISRDHNGSSEEKRFGGEMTFGSHLEALAESMALAMRVIDGILSGAENL